VPAPPFDQFVVAGVEIRLYSLCILLGLLAWIGTTARIWERGGGDGVDAAWLCILALVPALAGARLFSVLTDLDTYRGDPRSIFDLGAGGFGIWGAIAGGLAGLLYGAAVRGFPVGTFLDCAVPGVALGQAIGRFGNYFNQELYGGPSNLPWALHVDPGFRPPTLLDEPTFQPTFLYESLGCVAIFLALGLTWKAAHEHFRPGVTALEYVALYAVLRFLVEGLRIDPAVEVGPLRINQLVCLLALATAGLVLTGLGRSRRPRGRPPW
jgi:prolipoprotein diacylglyceryl transferase